jgi:hypothetical protein
MLRCGIILKPSTLLHFHQVLTKRKYHMLFSSKRGGRPGPKGPPQELIDAVVEMKQRNPTWGCPRIAQQITLAFGVDIDKDVVRRILGKRYGLESGSGGPSWLTFLGQAKVIWCNIAITPIFLGLAVVLRGLKVTAQRAARVSSKAKPRHDLHDARVARA